MLAHAAMQRARFAGVILAFATIAAVSACSSPPKRPATAPPSTAGYDDVAGRDDDEPPPPVTGPVGEGGNHRIRTFDEAKRELLRIYGTKPDASRPAPQDARAKIDLYCGCSFFPEPGKGLRVDLSSCGYTSARDAERAKRIEWEHAVPAAAFGRTFKEWTEGSDRCVDKKGKRFRGRNCARTNAEFSRMEADLHNLFPVVGEVNGLRSDLPMGLAEPHRRPTTDVFRFGACKSTIENGIFLPRPEVRGDLARAHKYMDAAYPERKLLDDARRALMNEWDEADPPDAWERERARAIVAIQGNANPFIKEREGP
jgi:deoxyribonuclease I